MGVTCPDPPPPQDAPPPRDSSPSQDRKAESTTMARVKHAVSTVKVSHPQPRHAAKSWQLSRPLQQPLSSSKMEVTTHDVFTEDGRERVCTSGFQYRSEQPRLQATMAYSKETDVHYCCMCNS